ncbi:MAG: hypothetical protein COB78_13230 [Hyphomicrobiales bacterium]|nr:MAG: hypothetical protein COB78_13230 [Hyphomicrobiales bacterium]
MIQKIERKPLFIIFGLIMAAAILGYLSFPGKIIIPVQYGNLYKLPLIDGCYQILKSAYIDKPGCYTVQEDLFLEKSNDYLAWIKSDNVSINLNGKTVMGPGENSIQSGVYIEGGNDIAISNGIIDGFMFGIRGAADAQGNPLKAVSVANVTISNSSLIGIQLAADKVRILDSKIVRLEHKTSKHNYVLDIQLTSPECYYSGVVVYEKMGSNVIDPLIILPTDCKVKN